MRKWERIALFCRGDAIHVISSKSQQTKTISTSSAAASGLFPRVSRNGCSLTFNFDRVSETLQMLSDFLTLFCCSVEMKELYLILKGKKDLPHDYNDMDQAQRRLAINVVLAPWANLQSHTLERLKEFGIEKKDVSACRKFLVQLKNGSLSVDKERKRGICFLCQG